MTELEASGPGEPPPPYIIFLVVFLFFLTGLLGFLVCHLLKKKGYRCRTGDMDEDEEEEEKLEGDADDEDEENQDTVEQILKCIIENEANMEAFNEMLGNRNVCVRHDPRLRKESIGGVPPHHHTVHSGTDHNSCHLCAQVRSKKGRRQSRTPRSKQRPGEQTVFSVGRFRVTHTDKKPHGGMNPLAISGDQLDQSQDSDERKEGGYNLRSMFKEVRPPPESANGMAANMGKRRKSVTIFGLRRGSDPVAVKGGEGPAKEAVGLKFAIQQQPLVLEEAMQAHNIKADPERSTKLAAKLESELKASVTSPSSKSPKLSRDSGPEEAAKLGSSPEPRAVMMIQPSAVSTASSAPSSLPIASLKRLDGEEKVLKPEEAYDPGPLQTSTPIAPVPGSAPGFVPNIPTDQPEPCSTAGFPVIQTPPDPSSSPNPQPGSGVSLALISLGSSPPSPFPIKTPSSASLLKTPTPPLTGTPSVGNKPSQAAETVSSPAPTPSPKLLSSRSPLSSLSFGQSSSPLQADSPSPLADPRHQTPSSTPADQNLSFPSSPRLTVKSGSVTSVTSTTKGDVVSSSSSSKELKLEGAKTPKAEEKTEIKRAGILKASKLSPSATDDSTGSSSDQLFKDRLSSLPLSPSSPQGGSISSVTIVKASPDSRREFSVVTTAEEEESSENDQRGETSAQGGEVGQPESTETTGAEVKPTLGPEKDDMMEMEDIRDCKVTQAEEEVENMELKQD
ncbi:RELT-like protein 2 [Stegastes partitus]|uniref:Flocculation protein FLO11-like n=1 Tax=Stegastes partitus TaxID=144197 RepID=A0A3B5BNC0_9TELE|nr:PREDICTED: flocculation protein FLO11-like [Stegastes partitus]XP_008298423.1 PREDICTED: flocculation protein FLO11-like [Stegastes partitus]